MAAPRQNLLSLGHLSSTEKSTFTKQREPSLKRSVNRPVQLQTDLSTLQSHQHLRTMQLQQRWHELKERELTAQHHNRQLLQQFEEAQSTLREMLTLNAAMKTIRVHGDMEYERYLEESYPRWQQQLKEKTQAAQRKKMEEYLQTYLKSTDERVTQSSADRPLLSYGSTIKPRKNYSQSSHLDPHQDGSPHLHHMRLSWQTHSQSETARFPIMPPYQPPGSSYVPSSFLPPSNFSQPFQLHHLTSMPGHHHPWPRQNTPGQVSSQHDYPWSWTAGIPSAPEAQWDQLYMERGPPSSKRDRGGGSRSSHLSQELDVKPVRLSSGPAESSESSRESSQASTEKRKKRERRGRSRCNSSDRERHSSQDSSRTSSAIITAAVTVAHSSESDASSEKDRRSTSRRRRRSAGLSVGSPTAEKVVKERSRSNGDDSGSPEDESQSTAEESRSEEAGDQSPGDKSGSCREESGSQREETSGSVSIKTHSGGGDVTEKGESSKSEESSAAQKDEEEPGKDQVEGDEEVNDDDEKDEDEEERDVEEEEEEEQESEVEEESEEEHEQEKSDELKNEDGENGNQGASSQDEEGEDEGEGVVGDRLGEDGKSDEEEEGRGEEEEEQKEDEAEEPEEERDSDDSIISPQYKSKKMHMIPEESEDEEEEEEESKAGSSDNDSNEFSDEDIEQLLAPQEQAQKNEEKDQRADERPKAICDEVEIFQLETDSSTKTDPRSDSEEFDNFYD